MVLSAEKQRELWDTGIVPEIPTEQELSALCEDLVDDLLLEHLTGRHAGILQAAMEFVRWHRQTQGDCPDEVVLEEALTEGFSEEEIAAALTADYQRSQGEENGEVPLWSEAVGAFVY